MHLRVGGVPEHFNLPWLLAIEEGNFADLGFEVEWVDFPGGTGDIMSALAANEVDLATALTEGAITSIAAGNPSRMVQIWVESPLLWAIHTDGSSPATTVNDLEGRKIAISRFGSGSELMARVLAQDLGWTLRDDQWVIVGDLDGALAALPAGDAEVFLWNKSITQPHVDNGTFKRVGELATPWPSFSIVAGPAVLAEATGMIAAVTEVVSARAEAIMLDPAAAHLVSTRYGLDLDSAVDWLEQIVWTSPGTPIDEQMLTGVIDRMRSLGRIDQAICPSDLLA